MRTQFIPCIIFSVDRADLPKTVNAKSRDYAEVVFKRYGISYEKVLGVYQGAEEYSYIVTSLEHTSVILSLARAYQQDSVLLRDNENKCYLKFFDGREPLYLGFMRQVDQEEALKHDAYTYSPKLNNYFRCVL